MLNIYQHFTLWTSEPDPNHWKLQAEGPCWSEGNHNVRLHNEGNDGKTLHIELTSNLNKDT